MITVLNFSHPLAPAAAEAIANNYGAGEARIIDVPVHLNLNSPTRDQLYQLTEEALSRLGSPNRLNVDCIILPWYALAAVAVARAFPSANIIRLHRTGLEPFMPTELIRPWTNFAPDPDRVPRARAEEDNHGR